MRTQVCAYTHSVYHGASAVALFTPSKKLDYSIMTAITEALVNFSGIAAAAGGEGSGEGAGKGTPVETVEVQWSGEVRAFTARLLLRDGVMQMSKDLGFEPWLAQLSFVDGSCKSWS